MPAVLFVFLPPILFTLILRAVPRNDRKEQGWDHLVSDAPQAPNGLRLR
jgi:hypothetical protein